MATKKKAPRRRTIDRSGPFATLDGKPLKVTRAATRRAPRAPKVAPWHIAVVVRNLASVTYADINEAISDGVWTSSRGSRGDWSAFIGTDREKVIHAAQTAAERWDDTKYEVWVGTLTGVVRRPTPRYDVRPLKR